MGSLPKAFLLLPHQAVYIAQRFRFNVSEGYAEDASQVEEGRLLTPPQMSEKEFEDLPLRPPVITVMGHVDHGKTTLLDKLRNASVAAGEAGGITQRIGAFSMRFPGQSQDITFLDTPGHAAFTSMRQRGTAVTDIALIVVAADDGVMPQTIEAIEHAKNANVPIIIGVNKIDSPNANAARVKAQLQGRGVVIEDFGGETPCVEMSAVTGQGIDMMTETILALAEFSEIRANASGPISGAILESGIDRGTG